MTRYIAALLFTAAAIAAFPLTMRGQNEPVNNRLNATPDKSYRTPPSGNGSGVERRVFRVSAYCCCAQCTSPELAKITVESGLRETASRHIITPADYGRICAAPKCYPFGTRFDLGGGRVVVCEDRGGSIKKAGDTVAGKVLTHDRLDILMATHQTALNWGVKYLPVTVIQAE